MSKTKIIISAVAYFMGMGIFIFGLFSDPRSYFTASIGVLVVLVPWFLCLANSMRRSNAGALWSFFIFILGALAIPIYLITLINERKTMPNKG